jgi:HK97 family phage major capsid protein
MSEIQNQLDKIGNLVDERIEKASGQIKDNARNEIDGVLKSEIQNLSNEFVAKFDEQTKRMDAVEIAAKKDAESSMKLSFKGQIEKAVNDGALEGIRKGTHNGARFELKSSDMTMANTFTGVVAGEQVIEDFKFDPSRKVHIRSLIPNGSTDAQTVRFPKESAYTDNAAATAQGSALGQSDFDVTATSVNMEKIGTFMKVTDELLSDTAGLSSYLAARVPNKVLSVEDTEILNGDGSSPNLDGLFTDGAAFVTSGGAFDDAVESANEYDVIVAALNQLALSNYQADTILLNPTDLHKIVLLKSTANEYLRQQIYTGLQPTIMGIPVTINTAVTAGKFLTMDSRAATQYWIRENLGIEFSREDGTNFQSNFVTVRAQLRAGLTNYAPNAIVQGTFSTAKAALETP